MIQKRLTLFASGSGTNAQNIISFFSGDKQVVVDSLFSNREDAYAIVRARDMGIPVFTFNKEDFYSSSKIVEQLKSRRIDLIVLAGFLWLIPEKMIKTFTIINIHPALLPNYGGKGMYGPKVHETVINNRDKESGITIHYVNEKYDEGEIIFQAKCSVSPEDTPDDLAKKVHDLEYKFYPLIIKKILLENI